MRCLICGVRWAAPLCDRCVEERVEMPSRSYFSWDERWEFDPDEFHAVVVVLEDAESLTRTLMHPDRICPGCGLRIWSRQAARVLGEHIQAEHPVEFAALTLFRDTP